MALVDTQGFVMAVDRSLFGPQGRRWIERKLPEVATNIAFVGVSAFGACMLVFHICGDFGLLGYWAILQTPKYVVNALIVHLVARALRWHIDSMLGRNFMQGDEALPDFFGGSRRGRDGENDRVLWPWQTLGHKDRTTSADSGDSFSDSTIPINPTPPDGSGAVAADDGDSRPGSLSRSAEVVNVTAAVASNTQSQTKGSKGQSETSGAAAAAAAVMNATSNGMRIIMGEAEPIRSKSKKKNHKDDDNTSGQNGREGRHNRSGFPNLFASCRPHSHHSHSPPRGSNEPPSTDPARSRHRRRTSFSTALPGPAPSPSDAWDGPDNEDESTGSRGSLSPASRAPSVERGEAAMTGEGRAAGFLSDDGGAGGHGAGTRGSRRRFEELTLTATAATTGEGSGELRRRKGGSGEQTQDEFAAINAEETEVLQRPPSKGGGSWRSMDTISRALHVGTGRQKKVKRGGDRVKKTQQLNFFTEADIDDLLHSTFFVKMCDDASWLYVEDHPYQPEMNWLLSLWGGYKIAPRFQGEVKQNEAHRMLFQCENGRQRGHVRIRSRATNTFLFFLGIKQPLTWVAWDRDVVGGDWEDVKLEWVGKPVDGVLMGDERGRVVIRSRPMNAYVSWNGTRFTHVPSRDGATVFMLQRMAPASRISGSRHGGSSNRG